MAGVPDVPPDRRVGPPHREGVRPQVEEYELAHVAHHLLRVPQLTHAMACHPSAHHLVVVEGHPIGAELPRIGLADVVEECGEPEPHRRPGLLDDGDRVAEHVLVPVVRIDGGDEGRELGEEVLCEARVDEPPQRIPHVVADEQLVQLVSDPLRTHDLEARRHLPHRRLRLLRRGEAQGRDESVQAEHPERVIGEGDLWPHRRPQCPRRKVSEPSEGVDELPPEDVERHRICGEVPTREVGLNVVAVLDVGFAGVVPVDLLAEGRDLERLSFEDEANRSKGLPHREDCPTKGLDDLLHLLGTGWRGEVEVGALTIEQCVAHRAAHQKEGVPGVGERPRQPRGWSVVRDEPLETGRDHGGEGTATNRRTAHSTLEESSLLGGDAEVVR